MQSDSLPQVNMLGHHSIPHPLALLAISLCPHTAATLWYSQANQTIGTPHHSPLVDLGYAVYKPTSYNVSLYELLKHVNINMTRLGRIPGGITISQTSAMRPHHWVPSALQHRSHRGTKGNSEFRMAPPPPYARKLLPRAGFG